MHPVQRRQCHIVPRHGSTGLTEFSRDEALRSHRDHLVHRKWPMRSGEHGPNLQILDRWCWVVDRQHLDSRGCIDTFPGRKGIAAGECELQGHLHDVDTQVLKFF